MPSRRAVPRLKGTSRPAKEDTPLIPRSVALVIAGAAGLLPAAAAAAPPQLALPLSCQPGTTCWIVNYVDLDPGDGVRDYTCGVATYNTGTHNAHNGTDFAIRDLKAMRDGVPVLAAAPGRVAGVRDGMADVSVRDTGPAAVANRECGNGVRIDHGDGWASQYCHMRSGSIAVAKGQTVTAGQPLGLVGLSGLSEFPHLHFQVDKDGVPTDPFIGEARTSASECGLGEHQLWNRGNARRAAVSHRHHLQRRLRRGSAETGRGPRRPLPRLRRPSRCAGAGALGGRV